jgi:hypothetical protein
VVVEDAADIDEGSATNTPAGEPDDFFSSWDKPSIKRPSNPPSRTGTPGITRTASPFLGANGNGPPRTKSPLTAAEPTPPTASRTTSTAALRKTTTSSKPKSNILGAKKSKLGAKKVDASLLDFDEAEKKAREEAERKERLGYDPDEETAPAPAPIKAALPEPAAPSTFESTSSGVPPRPKGDYGSGSARARDEEMERLNTSTRKLGFGQIGGGAAKAAAPKAKTMGFGSTTRAPVEGKPTTVITLVPQDNSLTTPPQTTPNATPAKSSASKKASPPTSSSAKAPSTRPPHPKPKPACKASKARNPSLPTPTSAVPKTKKAPVASRIMATWRRRQRTLCASLVLLRAMIWRTCRVCLERARRSCRVLLGIT